MMTLGAFALVMALAASDSLSGQTISPVEAKLVIRHPEFLPGVPFEMWIEVRNPTNTKVSIGLHPTLLVKNDAGEEFEVEANPDDAVVLEPTDPDSSSEASGFVTLGPGESTTLPIPLESDLRPAAFFGDARISPPGRYRFSVRLDIPPMGILASFAPLTYRGSVCTTEVAIERIQPGGIDAAVWRKMQQAAKGRWRTPSWTHASPLSVSESREMAEMSSVWEEIVSDYPESAYSPYALVVLSPVSRSGEAAKGGGLTPAEHVQRILEAIARFPDTPIRDLLYLKAWIITAPHAAARGRMAEVHELATGKMTRSESVSVRKRLYPDGHRRPCPATEACGDR